MAISNGNSASIMECRNRVEIKDGRRNRRFQELFSLPFPKARLMSALG